MTELIVYLVIAVLVAAVMVTVIQRWEDSEFGDHEPVMVWMFACIAGVMWPVVVFGAIFVTLVKMVRAYITRKFPVK